METSAHALLSRWETFYFLVGSSGAALTGLMFIVITLVMDTRLPRSLDTVNAFATPNVLHFAVVFLLSAVLTAPWQGDRSPAHVLGAIALAGVVYVLIVLRRMRRQDGYKPVLEDWTWHLLLPMAAYAMLFVGAAGLSHDQEWSLFLIGAVALLLLFIGIHNAWDTVTYMVLNRNDGPPDKEKPK